ncbi:Os02g0216500 [Oryza sativa Japonica Group]|uniref:Os02g0216500 protein n=1 Tax=Oryza sativa subsp. japonica TaxID=39947 RepID=Q0E2S8_ORYSJ|nr:hypothetical protein OsJ_05893 [Oryza sativa Japonica Group]BAF08210.1 Os02g0216500 [Oryza sativa Japonica Group]|eukprot:NP_001046296.1 Os02g0216500 [Oryza sativa Japonica Group]
MQQFARAGATRSTRSAWLSSEVCPNRAFLRSLAGDRFLHALGLAGRSMQATNKDNYMKEAPLYLELGSTFLLAEMVNME